MSHIPQEIHIPVKGPKPSVPWKVPIVLLVFAGLVVGLLAFVVIHRWERRQLQTTFDRYAQERFTALEQKMDALIEDAAALRGLFDTADDGVDRGEFDRFSRALHDREDDMTYGWAQRLTQETAAPFGQSPTDEQILIHYIEPAEIKGVIRQVDLDERDVRLKALLRACDTGEATVATSEELFGDAPCDWDYAIFMPVYRNGAPPSSVDARRRGLTGFVFAVGRASKVVERAMTPLDPEGIDLLLLSGDPGKEVTVAAYLSSSSKLSVDEDGFEIGDFEADVHRGSAFDLAGHRWYVVARPTRALVAQSLTWRPWEGMFGSWLLTGVLAICLVSVCRSRDRVRRLAGELRDACGQLMHAREEERERIAKELHDSVGQQVVALKLKLDAVENGGCEPGSVDPAPLKSAMKLCGSLTEEVRSMSYHLYPPSLHGLGLCAALRQMAFDFGPGPTVEVDWPDSLESVRLPADVEIALFRIAQEAVANAMRHSGSHAVHLTLEQDDRHLVLSVTDEGVGFDVDAAATVGLGLRIMHERANSVGAELRVNSEPGKTCVTVRAAVPEDAFE